MRPSAATKKARHALQDAQAGRSGAGPPAKRRRALEGAPPGGGAAPASHPSSASAKRAGARHFWKLLRGALGDEEGSSGRPATGLQLLEVSDARTCAVCNPGRRVCGRPRACPATCVHRGMPRGGLAVDGRSPGSVNSGTAELN
eukprot:scaffold2809_cov373-Prasinococcus_capsulatus_cf.AAC.6